MRRRFRIVVIGGLAAFFAMPAFAQDGLPQSLPTEYDLESLGQDPGVGEDLTLCSEFTAELRKLAGCGTSRQIGDPSLDEVNNEGLSEVPDDRTSPFGGIDPTHDVINGLPGGGGGFDAFGGAIDDLTGGLIPGDL